MRQQIIDVGCDRLFLEACETTLVLNLGLSTEVVDEGLIGETSGVANVIANSEWNHFRTANPDLVVRSEYLPFLFQIKGIPALAGRAESSPLSTEEVKPKSGLVATSFG